MNISSADDVKALVQQTRSMGKDELAFEILLDCFEQACTKIVSLKNTVAQQEKKLLNYSWQTNPDRIGGAFSEDELKDTGWK